MAAGNLRSVVLLVVVTSLLTGNAARSEDGVGGSNSSFVSPTSALFPKAGTGMGALLAAPIGKLPEAHSQSTPDMVSQSSKLDDLAPAVDTTSGGTQAGHGTDTTLRGQVSFISGGSGVGPWLDELLTVALDRDSKTQIVNSAVKRYGTPVQKMFKAGKDGLNYMLCNRGFLPSSEVGNVLLDENKSIKSRNLSELAKQQHIDQTHLKVVSAVMQLSMGLGMPDRSRGAEITGSALVTLNDLVGPDETNRTTQALRNWGRSLYVPQSVFNQKVWDIKDHQDKTNVIVQAALGKDPVAEEVKKKIHKYSKHGIAARASASVIESTLNAASLTPTLIGPAAQAALLAFFLTTGGTEEDKIIREVYLDKRLESRANVICQEANMLTDAYEKALLTRNQLLVACSESIVRQMGGDEAVQKAFGTSVLKVIPSSGSALQASQSGKAKPQVSLGLVKEQ